jgi:hypothetical protein
MNIDEIARAVRRDTVAKQRILARFPSLFSGMDAQELGEASGRELAEKMLRALGIEHGPHDDVLRLADAWTSGAIWGAARNHMNGPYSGPAPDPTKLGGANTSPLIGEARDSATETFLDKYLKE